MENLADRMPDKVRQMEDLWWAEVARSIGYINNKYSLTIILVA